MAKGRNRNKNRAPVPLDAQAQQIQISASASASFSGPLPPPEMLAQYSEVIENGAERIFAMVETQSAHRMQLENTAIAADISRGEWGLRAGIGLVLMAFGLVGYLAYVEEYVACVVVACVTVGSIGGAFIYGTISQRQERKERAEMLLGRK